MDKKDILKSVYDDFFGVNSLANKEKETENTGIQIHEQEVPEIIVKEDTSKANNARGKL